MKTRVMPSWESARPTWPRGVIRGGFVPVGVRVREPGSADSGCAYPHSQWQRQTSKRCPNGSAHEHEDDEAGHSRCVLSVRVASPRGRASNTAPERAGTLLRFIFWCRADNMQGLPGAAAPPSTRGGRSASRDAGRLLTRGLRLDPLARTGGRSGGHGHRRTRPESTRLRSSNRSGCDQ